MQLPDTLRRLAAAGTTDAVSKCRIDIDDAVRGGALAADAAAALDAVARLVAADIAANGPRTAKPTTTKPAGERHHATIRSARATNFSDTGAQVRGDIEVDGVGVLQFRVKADCGAGHKAFLRAMNADAETSPGDLVSRVCVVEVIDWTNAVGATKTLVNRWHPVDGAAKSGAAPAARAPSVIQGCNTPKPPKSARPAWESDSEIPF